jgi:hypothetical protein
MRMAMARTAPDVPRQCEPSGTRRERLRLTAKGAPCAVHALSPKRGDRGDPAAGAGYSGADALVQARALIAGGLTVLEITLRTPAAMAALTALATMFPDAFIGAGTIVTADQIKAAADAGARFLVSPGVTPRLLEAAVRSPVPFLPGVATASEALALWERGFHALKFFPAEPAGGARYLASLAGPLARFDFLSDRRYRRAKGRKLSRAAQCGVRRRVVDGRTGTSRGADSHCQRLATK